MDRQMNREIDTHLRKIGDYMYIYIYVYIYRHVHRYVCR